MYTAEYDIEGCYYVDVLQDPKAMKQQRQNKIIPLQIEDFNLDDFDLATEEVHQIPEIVVDPESYLLSLVNSHSSLKKSYVITLSNECLPVKTSNKIKLNTMKVNLEEQDIECTTLICVLPPRTVVDAAFLERLPSESSIVSDVRILIPTPDVIKELSPVDVGFPLNRSQAPHQEFKCCQGFGGEFTHYLCNNYFSIDFICNEGTEVLSCLPGTVVSVEDRSQAKGCHVDNFYKCNQIIIKHHEGFESEYVHLLYNSSLVKVGDKVEKGSIIAKSGNSGFSPAPHLHFQLSKGKYSIPFQIENQIILPGEFY